MKAPKTVSVHCQLKKIIIAYDQKMEIKANVSPCYHYMHIVSELPILKYLANS